MNSIPNADFPRNNNDIHWVNYDNYPRAAYINRNYSISLRTGKLDLTRIKFRPSTNIWDWDLESASQAIRFSTKMLHFFYLIEL